MKHTLLFFLLLFISTNCFAQFKEGEDFCETKKNESYFPLGISEKKFFWANSHYTETLVGKKKINGITYTEFNQTWKEGTSTTMSLRTEKGVVYQYEEDIQKETIRYDASFKKGHTWKTAYGNTTYTIISYDGKLNTPFCAYENLLVIKIELKDADYLFYYQRGKGFVGAKTSDDRLISCMTPTFEIKK